MQRKILVIVTIFCLGYSNLGSQESKYLHMQPDDLTKAQKSIDKSLFFKHFLLSIDLMPHLNDPLETPPKEPKKFYFAASTREDKIDTIAYYKHNEELNNFLLDREFNLYFAFIKLHYSPEDQMLSYLELFDTQGVMRSYIQYHWKGNSLDPSKVEVDFVEVFAYIPRKKDFIRVQRRSFEYGGGAFDKNIRGVRMGTTQGKDYLYEFYGDSPIMLSYDRYREDGTIQYSKILTYENNKLLKTDIYNGKGVLLESRQASK